MFVLIYSLQNLTDCDKILFILPCVNLSYRNVNVFRLTWIVSIPYPVKLSIRVRTAVKSVYIARRLEQRAYSGKLEKV